MIEYFHYAVVKVQFTNDDYRAIESSGVMPVAITKNQRIATPLTVSINPLTIDQYEGVFNNTFAPPFAGK